MNIIVPKFGQSAVISLATSVRASLARPFNPKVRATRSAQLLLGNSARTAAESKK